MHSTTKESMFFSVVRIRREKCLLRSMVTTMMDMMTTKNPLISVAMITMVLSEVECLLTSSEFKKKPTNYIFGCDRFKILFKNILQIFCPMNSIHTHNYTIFLIKETFILKVLGNTMICRFCHYFRIILPASKFNVTVRFSAITFVLTLETIVWIATWLGAVKSIKSNTTCYHEDVFDSKVI